MRDGLMLRWTFEGYSEARQRRPLPRTTLITLPLFVNILKKIYQPRA